MELSEILTIGLAREELFTVEGEHSAVHVGSGSARVLATPWLIAYMERTARNLLAEVLPDGYSSVGVHVDFRHLAPSPIGSRVRARVDVTSIQGVKVDFSAHLWDELELVGEGTHQRVVIEEERFLRRVAGKMAAQAGK